MSENNLDVRAISELLGENFYIPSYQRGYRWKACTHVKDLLDDLLEFQEKKQEGGFYCLQPIVVAKKDKEAEQPNKWEVIDGQQRLTTIFLILKYLGHQELYQIEYKTRPDSQGFLEKMGGSNDEQESEKNVDFYHIYKAYKKIEKWFGEKGDIKENFKNTLLKNCKIIWYEVEVNEKQNPIDIFTRLNMGKIPLTNAELIKALFLNSSNFQGDDEKQIKLKQLEIATEWDRIEYALQKKDLWCFISEGADMPTRIDFIFDLVAKENKYKGQKDATFRYFSDKFNTKNQDKIKLINDEWGNIKTAFQTIEEWFNDRELFHKVGFLIAAGTGLKKIFDDSKGQTKTAFKKYLDNKIAEKVKCESLEDLEYRDGKVKPILLLHNIQTMLKNKNETSKFPFDRYKRENWDIEHIHAIATDVRVKKEDLKKWLVDNFVESEKHKDEDLNQEIQDIKNGKVIEEDETKSNIIEYVLKGEDDNNIRNLCLLDSSTNRAYKNDGFKLKRSKIIEKEKAGTFIPICTRNVFMKYYSEDATSLELWNEADRESYLKNIQTILNPNKDDN